MSKYHAKVISLLESQSIDFRSIVYKIAMKNPKAVFDAIDCGNGWEARCKPLMQSGEKIMAIKLCREITGWGLAEAKTAVESIKLS